MFSVFENDSANFLARALIEGKFSSPESFQWIKTFKSLGILHILILSGTQVAFFSKVSLSFWALVLGKFKLRSDAAFKIFLAGVLILWVRSFGWPPPLTRALIFELIGFYSRSFFPSDVAVFAFVLHVALFPEHIGELGFQLSWLSFLIISFAELLKLPRLLTMVISCVMCTFAVCLVLNTALPTWEGWLLLIVANLTLGTYTQRVCFPCLAVIHFLRFNLMPLGTSSSNLGIEIMEILLLPFLVGVKALRYIGDI